MSDTKKNVNPVTAGVFTRIAGSLRKKEGFRHLWLGDSGMGKTTANNMLIKYVKPRANLVLTVDDKSIHRPEYSGAAYRANTQHLREKVLTEEEKKLKHISFRGKCYSHEALEKMVDLTPEEVASMAWDLVRLSREPFMVVMNIDELMKAQIPNSQIWEGTKLPLAYREGRAVGISVISSTQMPQMVNRESFGLSDTIGIFRMDGREAGYLFQQKVLKTKEQVTLVASLEVGQWILMQKSVPWDGCVYRFNL